MNEFDVLNRVRYHAEIYGSDDVAETLNRFLEKEIFIEIDGETCVRYNLKYLDDMFEMGLDV